MSWVCNSATEPLEMAMKWMNSLLEFLLCPSAMFDGIDTAHRLIWSQSPNFSSIGKDLMKL